ncbi:MAG: nuclear transport factor 2 family protein [Candidatus Promineofilum sp.]|jgi:ketosteroid isomerase-like protein|nr:nuclear transport factor 2 family protein [Promineifilum sp.]MCW5863263.1 nuclear transport factor 2 family protein [Anaerolineae bacterium]
MQASTELRNIIEGWFAAIADGDLAWAERHISRRAGVRLVGTDPTEWLEGPRVAEFLREEVKALGGVVKITIGETEAYCEGSVGWGMASPILTLPNGRQIAPRWSAVFHLEDDHWKLVQLHTSVGIDNEALLGG